MKLAFAMALILGLSTSAYARTGILIRTTVHCVTDNATNLVEKRQQTAFQGGAALELGEYVFWPQQHGEDKVLLITRYGEPEIFYRLDFGDGWSSAANVALPKKNGENQQCIVKMEKVKGKVPFSIFLF